MRTEIDGDLDLYVHPLGSDANAGTVEYPLKTINKAIKDVTEKYDTLGYSARIHAARDDVNTTYPESLLVKPALAAWCSKLQIIGDVAQPLRLGPPAGTNQPGHSGVFYGPVNIEISGFRVRPRVNLQGVSKYGLTVYTLATLTLLQGMEFEGGSVPLWANDRASINVLNGLKYINTGATENGNNAFLLTQGSQGYFADGAVVEFVNNPVFTKTGFRALWCSVLNLRGTVFVGGFTGQKYLIDRTCAFNRFGRDAEFIIPGTIPGELDADPNRAQNT